MLNSLLLNRQPLLDLSVFDYLSFSFNPHQLDLFPYLVKYFVNNTTELTMKFNDGGPPPVNSFSIQPGWADTDAYIQRWNHYIGYDSDNRTTNGTTGYFMSANIGDVDYMDIYALINMDVYYGTLRYCSCDWAGTEFSWKLIRNTIITFIAPGDGPLDAAVRAVESTPLGTPVFAIVAIGDGANSEEAQVGVEIVKNLTSRQDGRKYYFAPPRNVAATWRAWMKPPTNVAAMQKTFSDNHREDCSYYGTPGRSGYCHRNFLDNCCNSTFAFDGFDQSWWQPAIDVGYSQLGVNLGDVVLIDHISVLATTCQFNISISDNHDKWTWIYYSANTAFPLFNQTLPIGNLRAKFVRYETYNDCPLTTQVFEIAVYG